jgi:hypothetical protein
MDETGIAIGRTESGLQSSSVYRLMGVRSARS